MSEQLNHPTETGVVNSVQVTPSHHEHLCNGYCAPDSGMNDSKRRTLTLDISTNEPHFEKQDLLNRLAGDLHTKLASEEHPVFP